MRTQNIARKRRSPSGDRGSALLVSLMVMVGLSLLGLSFVALTETENAISINERNKGQTTAIAEAGANMVVQWFQKPETFDGLDLLPDNIDDFKTERNVSGYVGFYKPVAGTHLFDTPFGPKNADLFHGNEQNADIIIESTAADDEADKFLTKFNAAMFFNEEGGKVTSIRVYAPPNVGGVVVGGFWVGGQRYGVATIAVEAEKEDISGNVVARTTVRKVIAPFPLPGPTGAVQPVGGFSANGAYEVHWGAIESESTGSTYVKRERSSLPRFDPYDYAYIEYGYDSSRQWTANTVYRADTYPMGDVVRPTNAALAAAHEYVAIQTQGDAKSHATTEPAWDTTSGAKFWDNNVRWQERAPTSYPIAAADVANEYAGYRNHAWLYEMLRRPVEDPWFRVSVRGTIAGPNSGSGDLSAKGTHTYHYPTEAGANMAIAGNFQQSVNDGRPYANYFQFQTNTSRPVYKEVDIPSFDYDFWKAAALAAHGQDGAKYLQHVGSGNFSDGVTTQTFENWIAASEGFLFFDSKDNYNPQSLTGAAKTAALVDYSADPCGFKGVIYGNFKEIKTTGCYQGPDAWYQMPGEPYRDIGYRKVAEETSGINTKGEFFVDAAGNYVTEGAFTGDWSYQDLEWSNNGVAKNEIFDVCMAKRTAFKRESGDTMTEWFPVPYYPGCKPGNNITMPACECSEPHEPYLNLNYTGDKNVISAYWDDPAEAAYTLASPFSARSVYPKKTTNDEPTGTPATCTKDSVASEAGQENCTTNAYDKMGALAWLDGHAGQASIGMRGVLYNEGEYNSTGNAAYYGSVVVGGLATPNGTQEVWFDECLVKGCWPPQNIPFPRVMTTSTQIQ